MFGKGIQLNQKKPGVNVNLSGVSSSSSTVPPPFKVEKSITKIATKVPGLEDSDSEEESIEEKIKRSQLATQAKVEAELALVEKSADYADFDKWKSLDDGKFQRPDRIQSRSKNPSDSSEEQQPLFIHNMIERAKEKKLELERINERRIAKEQEADDELYADKEKFITSAYKEKLAAMKAQEEEMKKQELIDAQNDVSKRKDISSFYKNFLFGDIDGKNKASEREPIEKTALRNSNLVETSLSIASTDSKIAPALENPTRIVMMDKYESRPSEKKTYEHVEEPLPEIKPEISVYIPRRLTESEIEEYRERALARWSKRSGN